MVIYRLNVAPGKDQDEGENCDEWFGSLEAAKRRRTLLIQGNRDLEGHRYGSDYQIDRVVLVDLPPKQMALALLNRMRCFVEQTMVMKEYSPPND